MLAVAVCAVLAGARSFAAIGEWGRDLQADQLDVLGLDRTPVESTLRRVFARVDTAALDAETIVDAGADYVFTVKANRPRLLKALKALPWTQVPRGSQSTQHGHGRRATRTIEVIEVPTLPRWPDFTGAAQVAQLRRTVTRRGK